MYKDTFLEKVSLGGSGQQNYQKARSKALKMTMTIGKLHPTIQLSPTPSLPFPKSSLFFVRFSAGIHLLLDAVLCHALPRRRVSKELKVN